MSARLAVVAEPDVAALAGHDDEEWVRTVAGRDEAGTDRPVVVAELPGLWPAADELFELEWPDGDGVLVVGDGADGLVADLAKRAVDARAAERLVRGELEAAAVVVLLGDAMPPLAAAVLAAGRVLVAPRAQPNYALQPLIDHLAFSDTGEAVQWADSASKQPAAFDRVRVMGRLAAERHRASVVYRRLLLTYSLSP